MRRSWSGDSFSVLLISGIVGILRLVPITVVVPRHAATAGIIVVVVAVVVVPRRSVVVLFLGCNHHPTGLG